MPAFEAISKSLKKASSIFVIPKMLVRSFCSNEVRKLTPKSLQDGMALLASCFAALNISSPPLKCRVRKSMGRFFSEATAFATVTGIS